MNRNIARRANLPQPDRQSLATRSRERFLQFVDPEGSVSHNPGDRTMAHTFTTLRHPVEKLLEAEHFLARLLHSQGLEFQFELNAFLSAARSVTFVLQKSLSSTPEFAGWYAAHEATMRADPAMRFFLTLRNVSQKEGTVSIVGGALLSGGWTYRFVGLDGELPRQLIGRNIGACCADHLVKLAQILRSCAQALPYHCCPARAFTEDGMAALGYSFADVEASLGLPPGYTEVAGIPAKEKLRILSREVEPLDADTINRIAKGDLRGADGPLHIPTTGGTDLVDDVAVILRSETGSENGGRTAFIEAVMTRIDRDREGS